MDKSKIDWTDASWSPISGCYHKCEYCYARTMARRFTDPDFLKYGTDEYIHELNEPRISRKTGRALPYPFGFEPTLYRYRMDIPEEWKRPRNIFVCSMADMFGEWVPLKWIQEVFAACEKAPQHNYMFLTKNPARYLTLEQNEILPLKDNMWYGTTVTKPDDEYPYYTWAAGSEKIHLFLSIEPMLADFGKCGDEALKQIEWVIVGAETGNRKDKVIPEKSWVDNLVDQCRKRNIPVFMKESLRAMYGDNLLREFPKGLMHG